MTEIMAIGTRRNNAQAIRDAHELGYINGVVLDMTYGKGRFWNLYWPEWLVTNDLDPTVDANYHLDFTNMRSEFPDREFNTVVFDPPYKLNGTGGSHPSDATYGVANNGKNRMDPVWSGLDEAVRVCIPGGHILVKCQDQVVSGHKFWMVRHIANYVEFKFFCDPKVILVDQLHVRGYRPQPSGRRQVHSRQDYSTLLVFKKGKS